MRILQDDATKENETNIHIMDERQIMIENNMKKIEKDSLEKRNETRSFQREKEKAETEGIESIVTLASLATCHNW